MRTDMIDLVMAPDIKYKTDISIQFLKHLMIPDKIDPFLRDLNDVPFNYDKTVKEYHTFIRENSKYLIENNPEMLKNLVKYLHNDKLIYRLAKNYKKWNNDRREREKNEKNSYLQKMKEMNSISSDLILSEIQTVKDALYSMKNEYDIDVNSRFGSAIQSLDFIKSVLADYDIKEKNQQEIKSNDD